MEDDRNSNYQVKSHPLSSCSWFIKLIWQGDGKCWTCISKQSLFILCRADTLVLFARSLEKGLFCQNGPFFVQVYHKKSLFIHIVIFYTENNTSKLIYTSWYTSKLIYTDIKTKLWIMISLYLVYIIMVSRSRTVQ